MSRQLPWVGTSVWAASVMLLAALALVLELAMLSPPHIKAPGRSDCEAVHLIHKHATSQAPQSDHAHHGHGASGHPGDHPHERADQPHCHGLAVTTALIAAPPILAPEPLLYGVYYALVHDTGSGRAPLHLKRPPRTISSA